MANNVLSFRDFIHENYTGGITLGQGEGFLPEMGATSPLDDESNDGVESGLVDQIRPGDYVDFGENGKLYVCAKQGRGFWVSDDDADRFNPDASGWSVDAGSAVSIIERGGDANDDGEGVSDENDFKDAGNGDGVDRELPSSDVPAWAR